YHFNVPPTAKAEPLPQIGLPPAANDRTRSRVKQSWPLCQWPSSSSRRHQEASRPWRQGWQVSETLKSEKYACRRPSTKVCAADRRRLQFAHLGYGSGGHRTKLHHPATKSPLPQCPTSPLRAQSLLSCSAQGGASIGRRTTANMYQATHD